MTSITSSGGLNNTFLYNGLGLRVGKTDSTGTYSYLCDGTTPGSSVLSDGAAVYTPGQSEHRAGASSYPDFDSLGNILTLDAASGQVTTSSYLVSGFGTPEYTSGSSPMPFKYGGANDCQTDNDTGLILMGHRYYDTRIGRFISQDPAGDGDNWYAYCDNSPVNGVDPEGLDPCPPGCDQATWDRCAAERAQNFSDQENFLSSQFPDATIQHDSDGFPYVQLCSESVYACSDGSAQTNSGLTQSIDEVLTGGMATKSVQAAKSGDWGMAGVYFVGSAAMICTTMQGGEGRAGIEGVEILYRFGRDIETLEKLSGDAAAAEHQIGIYGVSTVSKINPAKGFVPSAKVSEIQKYFEIMKTGGPTHYTVKLPNPLLQEHVDIFNGLFGR